YVVTYVFFFSSRRRHTRFSRDWSSDVCSSDLPEVMRGLRNGTLHLLQTKSGQHTATAVDSASSFVANGRVVGDAGRRAVTGATVATGAVIMLPIAVAAIASYQQQQQLERALKDIQASLNRIEERMKDEEHGVCDAAESFISVATRSLASGALP